MRYGSVCSGIEAASAAWHTLGWQPAWFAEIEAFPSAVLAHHYPDVPNIGDFTQIAGAIEAEAVDAPDVLVGGTPCQAFSVAGLRMSLADARGNLSLAFVELANAIDNFRRNRGQPAGIIVWENVPGVLNTSDNAFGCFVGGLAGCDTPISAPPGRGWTDAGVVLGPRRAVAWRVLDAQYFGLAQRRRRVFVVASARNGFDPAAVLFEFDGVRRDFAPSREAREGVAAGTGAGIGSRHWPADVASTLNAAFGSKLGLEDQHIGGGRRSSSLATMAHGQGGAEIAQDRAPTLTCNHDAPILFHGGGFDEVAHTLRGEGFDASEDGTGRGTPLVPVSVALRGRDGGAACEVGDDVAFTLRASSGGGDKPHVMAPTTFRKSRRAQSVDDHETWVTDDVTNTLNCFDVGDIRAVDIVAQPVALQDVSGRDKAQNGRGWNDDGTSYTLDAAATQGVAVAFPANLSGTQCASTENLSPSLGAKNPTAFASAMQVRRLTPRECERLQGFPDDWTLVPVRGKPAADGPRYKALGNSMAVPCMAWIGKRIARQVDL